MVREKASKGVKKNGWILRSGRRTMLTTGPDPTGSATKDHMLAEDLNKRLGCLGDLVKDTAGATHALTCGVPDRESNDVRFLQEAIDIIAKIPRAKLPKPVVKPADGDHLDRKTTWAKHGLRQRDTFSHLVTEFVQFMGERHDTHVVFVTPER